MTSTMLTAAAELYRAAAGLELAGDDHRELADMLAVGSDEKWATFRCGPRGFSQRVLDARVLAGLFLYGEDIIWTARTHRLVEAFRRLRGLIEGSDALRPQVRRVSALNGGQRIEMHSGRRMAFATRPNGCRGLAADLLIADGWTLHDEVRCVLPSLASRPNAQLVIAA